MAYRRRSGARRVAPRSGYRSYSGRRSSRSRPMQRVRVRGYRNIQRSASRSRSPQRGRDIRITLVSEPANAISRDTRLIEANKPRGRSKF